MKKQVLFLVGLVVTFIVNGQDAYKDVTVLNTIVIDGDTMPFVSFPEFTFEEHVEARQFASAKEEEKYSKLKADVLKVYPYAKLAGNLLVGYNEELAQIKTKKEKREFTKKVEEELEREFASDLIKLSMNQQIILIKLIDRQTGDTSYEILQDYRGYVSAFFWQGLARIFGHNLKNDYDGNGDEKMIEEIIAEIERNEIEVSYSADLVK